jgi:hypothetical protein
MIMPYNLSTLLNMFSTSRQHNLRAATLAGGLTAATTLAPSTIAGIALAESAFQADGDLGILNYALTLEHFENALYRGLLQTGLLTGKALEYATSFGGHENTHVQALTKTISDLGGTPVKEQSGYNWPKLSTEAEVIAIIAQVEDLGASAYLGAAPLLKNADLLTVAVQIHTNEAEHATAFRFLAGQDPVPFAFAPPMTMAEVLAVVTPFLQAPAGAPSQMPNTGLGDDNTLKLIGIAGGIGAIAAGVALARSSDAPAATNE